MKRISCLIGLTLAISCGSGSAGEILGGPNAKVSVPGTWRLTKVNGFAPPYAQFISGRDSNVVVSSRFTFNSDGSYAEADTVMFVRNGQRSFSGLSSSGTWQASAAGVAIYDPHTATSAGLLFDNGNLRGSSSLLGGDPLDLVYTKQ